MIIIGKIADKFDEWLTNQPDDVQVVARKHLIALRKVMGVASKELLVQIYLRVASETKDAGVTNAG